MKRFFLKSIFVLIVFLFSIVFVTSVSAWVSGSHYCGDGFCDSDESCSSCSKDCGACGCPGSGCTKPDCGHMCANNGCDSCACDGDSKSSSYTWGNMGSSSDCNACYCGDLKCTPVDGGWSSWSSWSTCTKSCGGGTQYRTRSCNNPSPSCGGDSCSGDSKETRSCNTQACCSPVDGGWTDYTWGPCSAECDGGTQTGTRSCNNPSPSCGGASCSGSASTIRECNTQPCAECELKLTKTDNVAAARVGDDLIYSLTLENIGTADCTGGGVLVRDYFDQNTQYIGSNIPYDEITSTYMTWNFGVVSPGEKHTIQITMRVLSSAQCGSIILNRARYWSYETDWSDYVSDETVIQCDCVPGQTQSRQCGSTDTGECSYGIETKTCLQNGQWGAYGSCVGAVYASAEICDNKDNDCDSLTDEDLVSVCSNACFSGNQVCTAGVWSSCSANPVPSNYGDSCSAGVGECKAWGTINCNGQCNAIPGTPATEICDQKDNDCDGSTDEGNVCDECETGDFETRQCGSTDVGECSYGQERKYCVAGQWEDSWGPCTGAIYASTEICDEKDNDCDGLIDEGDVCGCVKGEIQTRQCGLSDVGECSYGIETKICICGHYWSEWSACTGAVYSSAEICDGKDNDCDGQTDENGVCHVCEPGQTQTQQCGSTDAGECSFGIKTKTCNSEGQWGPFGECIGAVYASTEVCDQKDNDCDGSTDEGNVCCECTSGDTRTEQCGSTDIGECAYGEKIKTCSSNGQWGDWSQCSGAINPSAEICDGKDNDCDGSTDEGDVCECNDCDECFNNHAPVLNNIQPITIYEGESIDVNPTANDADGNALSFSFGSPLNSNGEWTTDYSDAGTYMARVTVTDSCGSSDYQDVLINVLDKCLPECSDGIDNDGDYLVDANDPGCFDKGYYDPNDNGELNNMQPPQCSDTVDNDKDGLVDMNDPDCSNPTDNSEAGTMGVKAEAQISRLSILNDDVKAGDELMLLITFENDNGMDLEDLKITATIPELELWRRVNLGTVNENNEETRIITFDIPEGTEPGYYNIRVSVSNDNFRRTNYREFLVTN